MKKIAVLLCLTLTMSFCTSIFAEENQIETKEEIKTEQSKENLAESKIESRTENLIENKAENENTEKQQENEAEKETILNKKWIENENDARDALYSLSIDTNHCAFLRRIEDAKENKYYIFTQGEDGIIKVVTNPNGYLLGIVYHVVPVSDDLYMDYIRASQAEYVVQAETEKEPIDGTAEIKLSILNQDGEIESQPVWVVYTDDNTAHYVAMDGTYLYSLPVKTPGDTVSLCGNESLYIFDELTGKDNTNVSDSGIELMKGNENRLYLGDSKRKILLADYRDYIDHGTLTSVTDVDDWDESVRLLEAYIQAYDYFDSVDLSPVLILKDPCDKNGNPIEPGYIGYANGWHLFAMNDDWDEIPCDVACCVNKELTGRHEMNDDEIAICEIEGEICRHLRDGDSVTLKPALIRPYYQTVIKDSNTYRKVANELYVAGMSLEEARDFWFSVHVSLVPESDPDTLLPWVLENVGMKRYGKAVRKALLN